MYIILLIISTIFLWYLFKDKVNTLKVKVSRPKIIFWLLVIIVIYLIFRGHLHPIAAAIVALLPLIKKLLIILKYVPILKYFVSKNNKKNDDVTKKEAAEILNVKEDATTEEIILAHKIAMQKYHPDKGGSDYMARKINSAKDKLLS